MTEWRPVTGTARYTVSDDGEVIGPSGRVLKHSIVKGRHYVSIIPNRGDKPKKRQVHHIVLEAFRGECPPGMLRSHLDDDKDNNRLSNLAYQTSSQNQLDAVRNGKHWQSRKTHCPKQHELGPGNIYWRVGPKGRLRRDCKKCSDERSLRAHRDRRAKETAAGVRK